MFTFVDYCGFIIKFFTTTMHLESTVMTESTRPTPAEILTDTIIEAVSDFTPQVGSFEQMIGWSTYERLSTIAQPSPLRSQVRSNLSRRWGFEVKGLDIRNNNDKTYSVVFSLDNPTTS